SIRSTDRSSRTNSIVSLGCSAWKVARRGTRYSPARVALALTRNRPVRRARVTSRQLSFLSFLNRPAGTHVVGSALLQSPLDHVSNASTDARRAALRVGQWTSKPQTD